MQRIRCDVLVGMIRRWISAVFFFVVFIAGVGCSMGQARADDYVKSARLAGSWYPGDAAALGTMLDDFCDRATIDPLDTPVGVIISPHAGYDFSGLTAAHGFKAVGQQKINTVVILAPSHQHSFRGVAIWPEGDFQTPLGSLPVDTDFVAQLMALNKNFIFNRAAFEGSVERPENSLETQLPFIKHTFPAAKIVPLIVGYPPDSQELKALAAALSHVVGARADVLVDVSVDQSHFHQDAQARVIDARGLRAIEAMDVDALWAGHAAGEMEVDGFYVVIAAMLYAKEQGFTQTKVVHYATSADSTADKSSVVGYASVVFYRPLESALEADALTSQQKERLLLIARKTIESFLRSGQPSEIHETDRRLKREEGAFVTLHTKGHLRGCIGNILGKGPLFQTVRDMAVAAASEDPRFDPVRLEELPDIDIEISVLSKPQRVQSFEEIEMGKHGVIVTRSSFHRGVFLPQVAVETGWSRDRFLSELCSQKAGLPPDCWKDPATQLEVFTANVFGERQE